MARYPGGHQESHWRVLRVAHYCYKDMGCLMGCEVKVVKEARAWRWEQRGTSKHKLHNIQSEPWSTKGELAVTKDRVISHETVIHQLMSQQISSVKRNSVSPLDQLLQGLHQVLLYIPVTNLDNHNKNRNKSCIWHRIISTRGRIMATWCNYVWI